MALVTESLVIGSLDDWLAKSGYVWGTDQTSAVVGRKKCRAHRKGATVGEGHLRASDRAGRDGLTKVGNRRYRRWLNDQLLRDLAPPLDAADIESLFAPPPWGERRIVTPLERVVGGGANGATDMVGWEPFRNVDMDKQTNWIRHAEQQRNVKANLEPGKQASAMEAWRRVERSAREALRRNSQSPLLRAFEEKLLVYLSDIGRQQDDKELAFEAETSYHRLLLYGLTQFHGVASRKVAFDSYDGFHEGTASKVVDSLIMVKRRDPTKLRMPASCQVGSLNLVNFLREVQHHQIAVGA